VLAERTLLAHLRGGCLAPIGAWGRVDQGALVLDAVVLDPAGKVRLEARGEARSVDVDSAEECGREVAERLLSQGAAAMIAGSRQSQ
jgi:hydroxymethylbilane synthase